MSARTQKRRWTLEEDAVLRACYPCSTAGALAKALKTSKGSVYQRCIKLALTKSPWFKASCLSSRLRRENAPGAEYRFKAGHVPYNKGRKGRNHPGSIATQFKPGQLSGRAAEIIQPIGAERTSKDGYLQRKVNNDMPFQKRWKNVHLIIWEWAHGQRVPPGHAVVFMNGDKADRRIQNLELVSRSELMRRNTVQNLPKELAKAVQLRGAINRRINHVRKLEQVE